MLHPDFFEMLETLCDNNVAWLDSEPVGED